MSGAVNIDEHAALVARMADVPGVDLEAGECREIPEERAGTGTGSEAAPDRCGNRAPFKAMGAFRAMEDDGRLSRHFWLTQGMARTIGVNLNAALRSGRLRRDDHAQTVAACCACGRSQRCMAWMAHQGGGASTVPGYCAIGPVLEALRG